MRNDWNIKDDEIRIIGEDTSARKTEERRRGRPAGWLLALLALLLAAAGIFILFRERQRMSDTDEPGLFEDIDTLAVKPAETIEAVTPLGDDSDTTRQAYTEIVRRVVNDIPLLIYIPHNAVPELRLTPPDYRDKDIILAARAADIRRDNKKIVGAFVLKGEPLSWGLSKKGYCGIIDGKLTVGVADNSPLFEQATEKGGYFFRQYPLVDNGRLVENEPKNKSVRKALCDRAGEILLVVSETPESFHDFAQALVDLGVDNAIYLVGSSFSYGFWRDKDGNVEEFSDLRSPKYQYESYILWRGEE